MDGSHAAATNAVSGAAKKRRLEDFFYAPMGGSQRTPEEMKEAFDQATRTHPFYDVAHYSVEVCGDAVFSDAEGNVVGVLIRNAIPEVAREKSAAVLRSAATRTSLRATIFGGESPFSGIAGYYDYAGSPIDLKCRKTSFTCDSIHEWHDVFPLVEYVSGVYRAACPEAWKQQNDAIPDIVRINNSPFSTLTINQRFRTARHTDAGDFDAGFGILAVLEGDFEGLHLGLTDFHVCFHMKPRDMLLFNTHHFHANTELERFGANPEWDRLTCVFYYRALLGEPFCVQHYQRRLEAVKKLPASLRPTPFVPNSITQKENGENNNRPSEVHQVLLSPFLAAGGLLRVSHAMRGALVRCHALCVHKTLGRSALLTLFGETSLEAVADGLPDRLDEEKIPVNLQVSIAKGPALGGFSEATGAVDVAKKNRTLLDESSLKDAFGGNNNAPLLVMWREARALWLKLVARDWKHMTEINPDREDFSWKNKSDMNASFFDLCEVAKQVMLHLLGKEEPTKMEENAFWLCFAGHLYHACENELKMARDAMSMKKLNVKLKDFSFGGTRYFKDMPVEEQQRRILRKKRIEEARRRGLTAASREDLEDDDAASDNWLYNDDFDYQSEKKDVPYAANGWPTPQQNAAHVPLARDIAALVQRELLAVGIASKPDKKGKSSATSSAPATPTAPCTAGGVATSVVVVVPDTHASQQTSAPLDNVTPAPLRQGTAEEIAETRRLLENPAAKISCAGTLGAHRPVAELESTGLVSITFKTASSLLHHVVAAESDRVDVIILRHVLAFTPDDDAVGGIVAKSLVMARVVLVVEGVASCRSEYVLTTAVREAFAHAVRPCLQRVLGPWVSALPGAARPAAATTAFPPLGALRTKSQLTKVLGGEAPEGRVVAVYHFPNSPRNASVWVLA